MIKGHLHSIESLDTVDGSGLRYILFMQGCLLKCLCCHNPDTWRISGSSKEAIVDEVANEILPYEPHFNVSGDDVTVSGGEPLLQIPFLEKLLVELKENGMYTCLDIPAGCADNTRAFRKHFEELQKHINSILLGMKHVDSDKHIRLIEEPNAHILNFARKLSDME